MKKISEKIVFDGKWVAVDEMVYENKSGVRIVWETIRRKRSTVGVIVVARCVPSGKFILIKQFRPAVGGYVLGLPAGLAHNDPEQALTELKEETGYAGKIVGVSPVLKTGSSLVNDSGRIVCIEVDENHPHNLNPEPQLEAAEDIEVILVAADKITEYLRVEAEKGTHISANMWYMFMCHEFIGLRAQ